MPASLHRFIVLLAGCAFSTALAAGETHEHDIVVYGGTPAGIAASVQAARMGRSVVLIEPTRHLGGMAAAGGIPGDPRLAHVTGGIAREFHERLWTWYADDSRWVWEKRGDFPGFAPATSEPDNRRMWVCEPHVAGRVFDDLLRAARVQVVLGRPLASEEGVKKEGARILSITVNGGDVYAGRIFLDATYEGDLMAAAGVTCRTGREANTTYGETLNGVRTAGDNGGWAKWRLNARTRTQKEDSALLPGVGAAAPAGPGEETTRLTTGGLQLCVTRLPANRLPWPRPAGYQVADHELAVLVAQKSDAASLVQFIPMPNARAGLVLGPELGALQSDLEPEYLTGDAQMRRRIVRRHRDRLLGLLWTLANDERVPEATRKLFQQYGLCRDQWTDNGGVPPLMAVSGVRRMVSPVVLTEKQLLGEETAGDSVGLGSGMLVLPAMTPWASPEGAVTAEAVVLQDRSPQPVSFRSLFPHPAECANLLVPVCLGASHVGHASLGKESVFMVLGQSAGTAAALAVEDKVDVSALDYQRLRTRLLADGQVLEDDHLRREVKRKVSKEKSAADAVLDDLDRKTQERARARAAVQEKRRQEEGSR